MVLDKYCRKNPQKIKRDGRNVFFKRVMINYGKAIFLVDFIVHSDGKVDMLDDFPIVSNMSVQSEVFEYGLRTLKVVGDEEGEEGGVVEKSEELVIVDAYDAAKGGYIELMDFLIEEDLKLEKKMLNYVNDNTPELLLHRAVESGKVEVVQYVLDKYRPDLTLTNIVEGNTKSGEDEIDEKQKLEQTALELAKSKIDKKSDLSLIHI